MSAIYDPPFARFGVATTYLASPVYRDMMKQQQQREREREQQRNTQTHIQMGMMPPHARSAVVLRDMETVAV